MWFNLFHENLNTIVLKVKVCVNKNIQITELFNVLKYKFKWCHTCYLLKKILYLSLSPYSVNTSQLVRCVCNDVKISMKAIYVQLVNYYTKNNVTTSYIKPLPKYLILDKKIWLNKLIVLVETLLQNRNHVLFLQLYC